jgi:hypothetical protein
MARVEVAGDDFQLLPAAGVAAVMAWWGVLQTRVVQVRHRQGVGATWRQPSGSPRQSPPAVTVIAAPFSHGAVLARPPDPPQPVQLCGPAARCRAPGTAGRRGCRTAGRGGGTPGSASRRSAGCTDGRRWAWASRCICGACPTPIRAGW